MMESCQKSLRLCSAGWKKSDIWQDFFL